MPHRPKMDLPIPGNCLQVQFLAYNAACQCVRPVMYGARRGSNRFGKMWLGMNVDEGCLQMLEWCWHRFIPDYSINIFDYIYILVPMWSLHIHFGSIRSICLSKLQPLFFLKVRGHPDRQVRKPNQPASECYATMSCFISCHFLMFV